MAKRIYTKKEISPEVARENAISAAQSAVAYAARDVDDALALVGRIAKHGAVAADAIGEEVDAEKAQRRVDAAIADLARAKAVLAALV